MRTKKKIDDMILTIVAIQNIPPGLLDRRTNSHVMDVEINTHDGNTLLAKLLGKLAVTEQEDVDEEEQVIAADDDDNRVSFFKLRLGVFAVKF